MKIEVFTICWNEMAILPFAVDYWRRFASRVTVYDNGSTDGSVEWLKQNASDLVTVVPFDTGGHKNNTIHCNMKNDYWKQARGRADLVVVCDMDEFLITDLDALEKMLADGATVCRPQWIDLVSLKMPKYKAGKYLHQLCQKGIRNPGSKAVLFNPNKIDEMNYGPGAHLCNPTGDVKWADNTGIVVLHVNNALSLDYRLMRYHALCERRSQQDKNLGYGVHYTKTDDEIRAEWQQQVKAAEKYTDLIGKPKTTKRTNRKANKI